MWNGLFFEIIPKAKVAEHLKERQMAGRHAHIIKIVMLTACPHTFLASGRTAIVACFHASKQVLKLDHAGIGEHQRGIIAWHQRARGHDLMIVLTKVIQKGGADVRKGGHDRLSLLH